MFRHPAFATPPPPAAWDGSGIELIRIVDPRGGAIAWLAPDLGATCVGYAVRRSRGQDADWRQIIRSGNPHAFRRDPSAYGCTPLLLATHQARPGAPVQLPVPGRLLQWELVERDPTAAILETTLAAKEWADGRDDGADCLRLRLSARLHDATLSLELAGRSRGCEGVCLGLGLQATFAIHLASAIYLRDDSSSPGSPVSVPVRDGLPLSVPDSAGKAGPTASKCGTVRLASVQGSGIDIGLISGIRQVVMHAPAGQSMVSIGLSNQALADSEDDESTESPASLAVSVSCRPG